MIQLWVNLPSQYKMTAPRYQGIRSQDIPVKLANDDQVNVRVIAGQFLETIGPAQTFSSVNLWDINASKGAYYNFHVTEGHTSLFFVLEGQVRTDSAELITDTEVVIFEQEGTNIGLHFETDSKLLYLGGEPLNEPIVGHGPFVMNTREEILQAFKDFESGKMGRLR